MEVGCEGVVSHAPRPKSYMPPRRSPLLLSRGGVNMGVRVGLGGGLELGVLEHHHGAVVLEHLHLVHLLDRVATETLNSLLQTLVIGHLVLADNFFLAALGTLATGAHGTSLLLKHGQLLGVHGKDGG